jgi:hypothetical protein
MLVSGNVPRGRCRKMIDFYRTKRLNNFLKVRAPTIQRLLPFSEKVVPLIYCGHS